MNPELSRREFLSAASQVATAAFCVALCGCSQSEDGADSGTPGAETNAQPVAATRKEDGTFLVAGGGKLQPGQSLAFTMPPDNAPGILLLSHDGKISALSALCTHAGCVVKAQIKDEKQTLVCPCHNSQFSASGAALSGPATRPLPRFAAKLQDDDAVITTKS